MDKEMTGMLPGEQLASAKLPGHWLLARLSKRVLRPGGLHLTHRLLDALALCPSDRVVEFAPGLGITARLVLQRRPSVYTGVERDAAAAANVQRLLNGSAHNCLVGRAEATGLPDASATVVLGEALLTMQTAEHKAQIVREAWRLLRPGGRYGIHELCLVPDDLSAAKQDEILKTLSDVIHVGARPLTAAAWRTLLEETGFRVQAEARVPMHLLEPRRLIQDEGGAGALRFVGNLLRDRAARQRVAAMRRTFRQHRPHLAAIALVAIKPADVA